LRAKAAKTWEKGTNLCRRGNAIGAVKVVLGGAGRVCDGGSRHCARLAGRLPPFEVWKESRRLCWWIVEGLLEGDLGRWRKLEKRRDPMVAKVVFYGWIGDSYVHYA